MKKLGEAGRYEGRADVEIEQKYLLASGQDLKALEAKIKRLFSGVRFVGGYSETSYYFAKINKEKARWLCNLVLSTREELPQTIAQIDRIPDGMPIALRLRKRKNREDKTFILTFKASEDPLHDVERIEIETNSISENFLEGFAANGLEPESIWHSVRREYQIDDNTKIDVQDVTGYGWTAEIESSDLNRVKEVADKLGLLPVGQSVLGEMYRRYTDRWMDYYSAEGDKRHFSDNDWAEIEAKTKESLTRNRIID